MVLMRKQKQYVIAGIYFVITVFLSTFIYYAFIKAPETCFDNRQNQDEAGIDCGGVCALVCKEVIIGEDLQVRETAFVPGGENRYDVLGKIYNPNDEIGASAFAYTVSLKDSAGAVLASRSGMSYILPQENKYLLELNLETSAVPVSMSLEIRDVEWTRFSGYQAKPTISIYQKSYGEISSGVGFGEALGLLVNESPYDFRSIIVRVILRDSTGKPLAFNATEMRTVRSSEERDFRLVWPSAFPGAVEKVEMEVDADVYHSDNFIRQYLPGGKFQEFTAPGTF